MGKCTYVQNRIAIGQLFMEILHFKELGDTESVVTNVVGCLSSHYLVIAGHCFPIHIKRLLVKME